MRFSAARPAHAVRSYVRSKRPKGRSHGKTPAVAPSSYSTEFDLTQNPMVEDGFWHFAPSYWQAMRTSGGLCYGVGATSDYEDCVAIRSGINSTRQFVRVVLRKDGTYTPAGTHEAQIVLFGGFAAGPIITAYEFLFSAGGTFQCMRWRGGPGSGFFSSITGTDHNGGISTSYVDDMEFYATAQIVSGNPYLELYQDDVLKFSATDSHADKVTSGQPGMAAFYRPEVNAADFPKFCWKSFACGTF